MLKARVRPQSQALILWDFPLESQRGVSPGFGISQDSFPMYEQRAQPGLFIQGLWFLQPWRAVCDSSGSPCTRVPVCACTRLRC